jgi:phage FluMu protein Com
VPCYGGRVSESSASAPVHTVECPHCGQSFEAELLTGPAPRYSGFKCPHCKLFAPLERVDEEPAGRLTKQTP